MTSWSVSYEAIAVTGTIAAVEFSSSNDKEQPMESKIDRPESTWTTDVVLYSRDGPRIKVEPEGSGQVRCRIILDRTLGTPVVLSDVTGALGESVDCSAALPEKRGEKPENVTPSQR
ncbi:hypothetical protein V3C41_00320 [Paenarthrobacter nicotinovorans]|uniref:MmpS family membrane protein n=1 Tax=Paenarthrobacter nicotinovorans TaxID=29320 RepID=A0ABV0GLY7_PAENI